MSVRRLSEIRMELAPRLRVVDKVAERWPACQSVRPSATGRARPRCTNRRIYYWQSFEWFKFKNLGRPTRPRCTPASSRGLQQQQRVSLHQPGSRERLKRAQGAKMGASRHGSTGEKKIPAFKAKTQVRVLQGAFGVPTYILHTPCSTQQAEATTCGRSTLSGHAERAGPMHGRLRA